MTERLAETVEAFQSADDELRLELLLDFSKRLPALPEHLRAQADAGLNRVPECMSPVFLFIEAEDDHVRLHAAVAEEAPTVKGMLSIVLRAYDGATPRDLAALPTDLVNRLGLARQIRMNRAVGLSAILGRMKKAGELLVAKAAEGAAEGR